MAAGRAARAALAGVRSCAAWAWEEEECMSAADAALLRRIEQLCPEGLAALERPRESWALALAARPGGEEEDGWLQAHECSCALVLGPECGAGKLAAAAAVADAIEREVGWYFQERGGRLLGRRPDPARRPCARTVFARRLRRFAASALRAGDRWQLGLWCEFLGKVVALQPFTSGNLIWQSQFERCLAACLARLEALRRQFEEEDRLQLPSCEESQIEVEKAAARRGRRNAFCKARLQQVAIYRCALRARRSAALVRGPLGAVPGLRSLLRLDGGLSGALCAAAGAELAAQLLWDFRALERRELDLCTVLEDALASSAGASAAAAGRHAAGRLAAGRLAAGLALAAGPGAAAAAAAALLELLGPSCAALLAGAAARAAARRLWGPPGARALRCAYLALGLSPSGACLYAPGEVEAQLAWMLQQPGPGGRSLRLWAAYAYVRERQHPGLRDPWAAPAARGEERMPVSNDLLDEAWAWRVLNLDPDAGHSAREVRKRYLQLLLARHPDKPAGDAEAFAELREAYERLRGGREAEAVRQ